MSVHGAHPRLAILARLVLAATWLAVACPAGASLMLTPPPYRPKDFTMVKRGDTFHLFYIRRNVLLPMDQSERDLGHAVSVDLYNWTQLDSVLPVRDPGWDNLHVWAPSIVERDGVYYLFYTGVSDSAGLYASWQRTGLATSTDLMTWNRMDEPVFSCVDVPWAWCDSLNVNTGFRDPFVMPDPAHPGQWLMYYSTFPAADTLGMIVGVATSDGDFARWTDLKPLWITNRAYSYNSIVESPHLFEHAGWWYLFFTTNAGLPISYAMSHNPVGEPNEWFYRGRLGNMLGTDTRTWIASEYFRNGRHEYFMFVNFNRIEIYEMLWNPDLTFSLWEPGAFHVRSLSWSSDSVATYQNTRLAIFATGWASQTAQLEAYEVLRDGSQVPVPMDSLGLPSSVPLTADTTFVPWNARIYHANGDTTSTEKLVVRMQDLTAEAPPLTVAYAPPPPPPPPPPDPTVTDPDDRPWGIRPLVHPAIGGGTGVLVTLPAAAQATVDVYDIAGRRVRNLARRELPKGATVLRWDGRDGGGASVDRGIYFVRLVTPLGARTARLFHAP